MVLLQERTELFSERSLGVMLLLVQDVIAHRILAGLAHAESSVAGLPSEAPSLRPSLMNPSRGIGLDQAREIGHRMGRRHANQQMNVIRHPIDAECNSTEFADNAANVPVKVALDLRGDLGRSVMGAKDEVDDYVRSRMAHALTPLRGWLIRIRFSSHGFAVGSILAPLRGSLFILQRHSLPTPNTCGPGCGIESPRQYAWAPGQQRLPNQQWCGRLSECDRGRGR